MKENKYAEMQKLFEEILKLETPPVAVKFVRKTDTASVGASNIKPITFCQAVTIARQGNYSLKLSRETLSCPNARFAFGIGTEEELKQDKEKQISKYKKYAPDENKWRESVEKKYSIPPGNVTGVMVAPLSRARFIPDCLIFTVIPWQAYYLFNAYFYETGDAPLNISIGQNSLVCAYSAAISGWEKKINLATACTGGRSYAGIESTQLFFSLPWELTEKLLNGLKKRNKVAPYPGLIVVPLDAPKPEKHFFRETN